MFCLITDIVPAMAAPCFAFYSPPFKILLASTVLQVPQALQDNDLLIRIDEEADETLTNCCDRSKYFIGQIESEAIYSRLVNGVDNGVLDAADVYNIGISFFNQEAIRSAIGRRFVDVKPGDDCSKESVQFYLEIEYLLQDELDLPIKHEAPKYAITQPEIMHALAKEVGDEVKGQLVEDDGSRVWKFMSGWEPWKKFLMQDEGYQADFNKTVEIYANRLEHIMAQRLAPNTATSRLTEQRYNNRIDLVSVQKRECEETWLAQKTKEVLMNVRGEMLENENQLPEYFNKT